MIFIDEFGLKYKAVKKNGEYYLLTIHSDTDKHQYYKVEVKGKQNVLTYIKNNKLQEYEEDFYE